MTLFFRKQVAHFFSIEKVFFSIAENLTSRVSITKIFLPHYTSSIANIIRNLLFARKHKDKIYHITGDVHYVVLALPGNRCILTIHDCVFLHHHNGFKKWFLQKLFLTWPVKHSQVVTTISEQSKKEIMKFSGCAADKIRVINNPVTPHITFKPKEFNSARPRLLFLGSTPNKNLVRAIEAITGLSCVLHIVGVIPEKQLTQLKQAGIEYTSSVNLSDEELANAYYDADVLFFPTLYEGFGLPIIEAQKAGRAVLTSDLSPMKEVAGGGACLVDPIDVQSIRKGLTRILTDKNYRAEIIANGIENVKRFGVEKIAGEYLQLYKEVESRLS